MLLIKMTNPPSLVESPLSVKHENIRLIIDVRSDNFKICESKVIPKKTWLGLKEETVLAHRKDTEKWEILYL